VDLGTHGGVCGLVMEGRRPVDLGKTVADRPALSEVSDAQHTDLVTQIDGR
jgi:hypothetical protein